MADLALIYGLRLLPADELATVADATVRLKTGKTLSVAMHLIQGSKDDLERQLRSSIEAFFDFYPEI